MSQIHFAALDLNLLRVFDALMEERSVTRAGARLGLSQSAVSHALNRLRHMLNDPLFHRTAQGMVPTAAAREFGPRIHAALGQLQAALTPTAFDPRKSERRFVIVAGAYACAVIVPGLVTRMSEAAPGAELLVTEAAADLMEQLDSRRVDFLLGSAIDVPQRLTSEPLLQEKLAWIVRAGHPLAGRPVTMEELAGVAHVSIARERPLTGDGLALRSSWEDYGVLQADLEAQGLRRRIGVTVPDVYAALGIVRRTNMAALIPTRVAQVAVESGLLTLLDTPYCSPPVDMHLLGLRERMSEPAVAWMREQILATCSEVLQRDEAAALAARRA